ncbi:succinate dehydrogenase assembly factor 2 [Rheinheimera baltica]|uniref:FAD assembly factor SdhE n=1 Tax=Rheinheimera baltica TaxID=67576 RepID=A0ABT9HWP0_9GAMM|nr:succinate dehydrogenase assembly factor 2 [Rheinheimera baltica]MDP5135240.1 succinate dehydrogenase assembly factor 2 [Rheinheimera baltica]MDP5151575.1 succinate dehydrogenase assembly factor 2 [Rheinheimera baltica]
MPELMIKPRLRWACRRGMLELDVLLAPFVEAGYDALTLDQKRDFERLLACDDPDLFSWFMGHATSPDPAIQALIKLILDRVRV